ncbi:MAG: SHOCT domain-containing protein [Leptolyngbya sp. UWPOB_LEPTO1]|uniref:SHOCT domain-containing protein n=1 Tax=Leptolyngbya sp. UWPOB_LEPTO1 TaxID=2815653 RepID=UPI001AD4D53D|nr:SHOCT domain-containing protein [Leptolyngbya sp. UWPOB_LEPTO1]MBN8559393.1 SHOCT domain-containing protein [Leptolyngbya sp. UWPOB_LEPTO1]
MLSSPKSRRVAAILALAGAVPIVGGFHLVGLHKLYLGQRWWCLIYVALALTGSKAAWIAGLFDAAFYLIQNPDEFDANFNDQPLPETGTIGVTKPNAVVAVSDSLRELDQLRQDGLISEYEFEQKRRKLLDRIK